MDVDAARYVAQVRDDPTTAHDFLAPASRWSNSDRSEIGRPVVRSLQQTPPIQPLVCCARSNERAIDDQPRRRRGELPAARARAKRTAKNSYPVSVRPNTGWYRFTFRQQWQGAASTILRARPGSAVIRKSSRRSQARGRAHHRVIPEHVDIEDPLRRAHSRTKFLEHRSSADPAAARRHSSALTNARSPRSPVRSVTKPPRLRDTSR